MIGNIGKKDPSVIKSQTLKRDNNSDLLKLLEDQYSDRSPSIQNPSQTNKDKSAMGDKSAIGDKSAFEDKSAMEI